MAIPGLSPDMNPANPATPVAPVIEPTPPEPKGLDKFSDLFDNDKTKVPKEGEQVTPPESPTPFDPVALLDNEEATTALLSKLDFSKSISEDTQALITANDPGALLALTNDIGKQAYMQAMRHTAAINKRYVDEQLASHSTDVTSKINSQISDRELATLLPEIKNPLVAAGIETFVERFRAQNPTASTSDVVTQVKEYLGELNSTVNKPPPDTTNQPTEIDWFKDLGIEETQ